MAQMKKDRGRILVLEDDPVHAREIDSTLGRDHELSVVRDPRGFVQSALSGEHDLLLVIAAGQELAEICRSLGESTKFEWVPIVAMTAGRKDCVVALESGAIDCVTKAVDSRVLALKLDNFIRCKQIHERVRKSEEETRKKIEELESLIQMVVHDLKSPVIAIHGFIEMLAKQCRDLPTDSRRDEILSYLAGTSTKIQEFIKDLEQLLVSEEIRLELSHVSLKAAVQEVLCRHEQVLEAKGIDVRVHACDFPVRVLGDERRIVQIVDNLFANAINHMGDGPGLRIEIRFQETDDFVVTTLADNGIGIPLKYHDKIFNRFFRVPTSGEKPGTGLGLSIVKSIVESHGGKIWVESIPGQGTAFRFTLPKEPTEYAAQQNSTGEHCILTA